MLQVVQDQKSGEVFSKEVPNPKCHPYGILVRVYASTISAGTEKASVDNAKGSLIQRAKKQPEQVKLVLDTIKQHGIKSTIQRVRNKLNSYKALGYSAAGIVLESNVNEFKPGDRVAVGGAGLANHSELVSIPKNLAIKIPDNLDYEESSYATVGSIAMQGVRQADPRLGETVAVIGLGLLGIISIQLLKAAGCRVVGLDINQKLFDTAKKFGADACFDSSFESVDSLIAYTRGLGFDSVVITAGTSSNTPLNLSMQIARKRGKVVIVGAVGLNLNRNPWYTKEIDLKISCSYGPGRYDSSYEEYGIDYPAPYVRWTENRNMQSFLDLISDGKVNVKSITTHKFKIEEANKAYQLIDSGADYLGINLLYDTEKEIKDSIKVTYNKSGNSISFIGCGQYAQNYLLPPLKKQKVDFFGVSTNTSMNAEAVKKVHDFKFATTDSESIINDPNSEIIFIASRHDSHADYVNKALSAGKSVFVEKPLAINLEELEEISEIVHNQNPNLMVGYNRRFSKPFINIKNFLGDTKQPIHVAYRVNAGKIPKDHWSQHPNQGGRIIGEVCHFIDAAIFFSGSIPISVYAESFSGDDTSMINNDNVSITLKMKNGSTARVDYIASGGKAMSKEYIEVFSSGKSAVMDNFNTVNYYTTNSKEEKHNGKKGIDEEVEAVIKAFTNGNPAPIPFSELYASAKACILILESLKLGKKIEM